jgi:hypothetical protein
MLNELSQVEKAKYFMFLSFCGTSTWNDNYNDDAGDGIWM